MTGPPQPLARTSVPVRVSAPRQAASGCWPARSRIVALPAAGDVLPGVVDDVVGAERADQLGVADAAHADDVSAEGLGDLHGERADASRCAVDQHRLAGLHLADVAQALQGGDGGDRHRCGLLDGQAVGLGGSRRSATQASSGKLPVGSA